MGTTEEHSITIPGYELLEKVGEGGMGTVYRARQISLQRVVAVKLLRGPIDGAVGPRAFQWETQLLASLSHPNVLAIHDCAQIQGRHYLVTEFVPGASLRELMQPGQPWPTSSATALLDKVAGALSYIHRHGILHLDLKPENVLCTPEGEIKIADFGLAQPQVEATAMVEQEQIQGTLDYCSLEQRHGLPTDARSDLYSLAVLSYELLTGHLPGRAYEKASRLNPALPAAVDDVLCRGLARRKEQRQSSIDDFRRELAAALRPKSKRVAVLALATAAVLAIVAVLALAGDRVQSGKSPRTAPLAWLIGDDGDSVSEFAAIADDPAERVVTVLASERHSERESELPLPCWPTPRPVLCVKSAEGYGFFHPLYGIDPMREMLTSWPAPAKWPAMTPEDNFLLVGDFSGKRLWRTDNGPWDRGRVEDMKAGDGIDVACPPDRHDNPALLLDKSESTVASPLICYQWIPRLPDPAGRVMVLRFRARAEIEKGRLSVGPTMPVYLPKDDHSPLVEHLRKRSTPHLYLPVRAGIEAREYRLQDWVQPTQEWQIYCVVWEWPPYCTEAGARNVVIEYQGLGKVWLDDVELFTWERGNRR